MTELAYLLNLDKFDVDDIPNMGKIVRKVVELFSQIVSEDKGIRIPFITHVNGEGFALSQIVTHHSNSAMIACTKIYHLSQNVPQNIQFCASGKAA